MRIFLLLCLARPDLACFTAPNSCRSLAIAAVAASNLIRSVAGPNADTSLSGLAAIAVRIAARGLFWALTAVASVVAAGRICLALTAACNTASLIGLPVGVFLFV